MIRKSISLAMWAFSTLAAGLGIVGTASAFEVKGSAGSKLLAKEVAQFEEPWAMTFLPDGAMLVTEKSGSLLHVTQDGQTSRVGGVPKVAYGGQGGLGDVVAHPKHEYNRLVYLSYAEAGRGGVGAVVVRARLDSSNTGHSLGDVTKIWDQSPKVSGRGHYSHRLAFGPIDSIHRGKLLITSGDRQKQTPAQDMNSALGKIIRLNTDGTIPADNPFQDSGNLAKTFWSIGHRNLLGIDFDPDGRLWTHEMGPRHGDELNLIAKGENYGWPLVSNGDHYSGVPIPDHDTRPEFVPPKAWWTPSIAPSGLVIYDGEMFKDWMGDAFIGGLRSQALIRVDLDDDAAKEAERFSWGRRIREVEQGPSGALWVLEDGGGGRLLKLVPAS